MVRKATNRDSRVLAEMAVQMWNTHTVDELQEEFAEFYEQVEELKKSVQENLDNLEILKKSLMQKYFG